VLAGSFGQTLYAISPLAPSGASPVTWSQESVAASLVTSVAFTFEISGPNKYQYGVKIYLRIFKYISDFFDFEVKFSNTLLLKLLLSKSRHVILYI